MLNKTDWDKFARDTGADIYSLQTWEGLAMTAQEYYEWSEGRHFLDGILLPIIRFLAARSLGMSFSMIPHIQSHLTLINPS